MAIRFLFAIAPDRNRRSGSQGCQTLNQLTPLGPFHLSPVAVEKGFWRQILLALPQQTTTRSQHGDTKRRKNRAVRSLSFLHCEASDGPCRGVSLHFVSEESASCYNRSPYSLIAMANAVSSHRENESCISCLLVRYVKTNGSMEHTWNSCEATPRSSESS